MSEQPRIAPPSKDFLDARRRENAPPPPPGADESGWQWIREYEVWPGRNVFCCFGHLMTGPVEDIGPNSCAWFLLLTPMVLFFFTWGVTLWYASLPLFAFPPALQENRTYPLVEPFVGNTRAERTTTMLNRLNCRLCAPSTACSLPPHRPQVAWNGPSGCYPYQSLQTVARPPSG